MSEDTARPGKGDRPLRSTDFPTLAWQLSRATDTADGAWYGLALFGLDADGRPVVGVPKR